MKHTFLLLSILICSVSLFAAAACCHDNIIMRENNENMKAAVYKMQQEQQQHAAEIRQIKTDTEIILRLAAGGDYMEVQK